MPDARPLSIPTSTDPSDLTSADVAILAGAEQALEDGLALKRWWERAQGGGGYAQRFPLIRQFNQPARSFGFFDVVPLAGGDLPVMGSVQEAPYDEPKQSPPEDVRGEFREFLLHYFMRVSSFRQPEAYADVVNRAIPTSPLRGFSLCTREDTSRGGFGFQQLYFKSRATGEIGKFSGPDQYAIVDLRDVGTLYEWIILKVQIFDFTFTFRPLGTGTPQWVFTPDEASYLILSGDFIRDRQQPAPDVLGEYGLGYAFIKDRTGGGRLAYGPGQFDAAFQLINFRVMNSGEIRSNLVFVANRPERILNISFDPLAWGAAFADLFSLGLTARLFPPDRRAALPRSSWDGGFDPVLSSIRLLNWLTGGLAARDLCISKEELERRFLVQHFMQHYQTIVGSLMTWRQIPDWLDASALPRWVITGTSS